MAQMTRNLHHRFTFVRGTFPEKILKIGCILLLLWHILYFPYIIPLWNQLTDVCWPLVGSIARTSVLLMQITRFLNWICLLYRQWYLKICRPVRCVEVPWRDLLWRPHFCYRTFPGRAGGDPFFKKSIRNNVLGKVTGAFFISSI